MFLKLKIFYHIHFGKAIFLGEIAKINILLKVKYNQELFRLIIDKKVAIKCLTIFHKLIPIIVIITTFKVRYLSFLGVSKNAYFLI